MEKGKDMGENTFLEKRHKDAKINTRKKRKKNKMEIEQAKPGHGVICRGRRWHFTLLRGSFV